MGTLTPPLSMTCQMSGGSTSPSHTMHAHYYNLPGFLSPKECRMLVDHATRFYPPQQAVVGGSGSARLDSMRKSEVRWLDFCDPDLWWFYRRIEKALLDANRESFGYTIQHTTTELQFTTYYGTDDGHYDWHEDNSPEQKRPMDRKLSFVIQLSDPEDYKGGTFELKGDPLPAGAYTKQGDALIFRSGLRHRVMPVTEGTRRSFVTWVHGPRA